uniref:Cytochrome b n=1 Tax=Mutilla europaea TaxID=2749339 RepID=A0A7L7S542_9HYME|nr:cytochrome b [Mutilla europaea]
MKTKIIMIPMPMNINSLWNMGSILGFLLITQIISGLILSMNFCPNISLAFQSTILLNSNTYMGWLIRNIHINGASMFFMMMFIHIGRGLYFHSYNLKMTWMIGISILLLSMMTAFVGYILPWGQMSFWGATVITNLLSVIPYIGQSIVEWIWGGFSINNATLNRFFSIHFLLPIIIIPFSLMHIISLHSNGSSNPLGLKSLFTMIPFHPYFTAKDLLGILLITLLLIIFSTQYPDYLVDPDNYSIANPLVTPTHIKPEWYFLFAYAILRSVPSKLGGVMCLIMSILVLIIPMFFKKPLMKSIKFYPMASLLFWMFSNTFIMLTWLGSKPLDPPYIMLSQVFSVFYFLYFIMLMWPMKVMDK